MPKLPCLLRAAACYSLPAAALLAVACDVNASPTPAPSSAPAPAPSAVGTPPTPGPAPVTFQETQIRLDVELSGLTHLIEPDDGSGRLFILEQVGRILTLPKAGWRNEDVTPEVFLDIRDQVSTEGWEEGLLGLAFHPEFADNGRFYVHYSAADPRRGIIARYAVSEADPSVADPDSEEVILEVDQPYGNHNGGQLAFGPDGYLYIALGDGGSGGDPEGHGQNPETLLGTVLRIDVDRTDEGLRYAIPPDNPFVNDPGARDEIWVYGLRNPWRFSFDRETGDLWIADVGQDVWESVYVAEGGENFGWNIVEGEECYPPGADCDPTEFPAPVHTYRIHQEEECSITGGYVYRGHDVPELHGQYIFGDFCSGRIWGLRYQDGTVTEHELLLETGLRITSFGQDLDGELYVVTHEGEVYALTLPAEAMSNNSP